MATVYDLSKARRRTQAPVFDMPQSLLTVAAVFGFDLSRKFTAYSLIRRRKGTEVHIRTDYDLSINISYFTDTYPPNFKAARQWIAAIADRYAWQLTEVPWRRK